MTAVTTWTSVHVHAGAHIAATVHPDGDRAVIELSTGEGLRTAVSLFADRAELHTLHQVIAQAAAELDAHVPPVRITAADSKRDTATPAA